MGIAWFYRLGTLTLVLTLFVVVVVFFVVVVVVFCCSRLSGCHSSPVHFVLFCQLLALSRYGTETRQTNHM